MKKIYLLLLMGVFLISFVSAVCQNGILNKPFVITSVCENCTQNNLTQVTYPNGSVALLGLFPMTANGSNYNYSFLQANYTGTYEYVTCGNPNGVYTCQDTEDRCFLITPSGESPSTISAVFYVGLLSVLLLFFILILFYGLDTENVIGKTFSIGFGYLFLIAIFFVAWQMGENFIFSSPFLVEFFRIGFIVLMIGFFPLLIILFAYGSYMMLQIKEIQDMQERGISIDEINERKFGSTGRY